MITLTECMLSKFLWEQFVEAITPEVAERCYRTPFPAVGERVWHAEEDGKVVGWGALIKEPLGPNYMSRAGVFPDYQRGGRVYQINCELAKLAFADPACTHMNTAVLLSNSVNTARRIRQAKESTPEGIFWGFPVGCVFVPPPGVLWFSLPRERWEKIAGMMNPWT